ncbi:Phosphoadenosine phosphosulfate reductase family protein [Maridesulfovibrio ferrireducens]|uniref:Phosphoadenosine phosphosulfate reductase family protein n=1 Tax=Maridesulfovibrio ferrireducens TaxID=246191 RepID=A0A1G9EQF3_9BACT|nr:phosphoadenosine phosphosulfate reductase family protein [Maridesulfovibrio ferrireducens]SDK78412.1 Phosphoadenosine phosphosulfate reductase family protein [Maridesulfovibrio ferrireducens]
MTSEKAVRHILGISGGKDSAALAIYLKEKGINPNIEYFFLDTGVELPEVYTFIDKMEAYLDAEIIKLGSENSFEDHLKMQVKMFQHENFLPSPIARWCTKVMKIQPLEKFMGNDNVVSYIGIRADEKRIGYVAKQGSNVTPVYPFKEDGIVRDDVFRILRETVGIPEYYKWRSRSGCYFCFFQRRDEWIGLHEHHPGLFKQAMAFEKIDPETGKKYTWVEGETLKELLARKDEILAKKPEHNPNISWQEAIIEDIDNDEYDDQACMICSL